MRTFAYKERACRRSPFSNPALCSHTTTRGVIFHAAYDILHPRPPHNPTYDLTENKWLQPHAESSVLALRAISAMSSATDCLQILECQELSLKSPSVSSPVFYAPQRISPAPPKGSLQRGRGQVTPSFSSQLRLRWPARTATRGSYRGICCTFLRCSSSHAPRPSPTPELCRCTPSLTSSRTTSGCLRRRPRTQQSTRGGTRSAFGM